MKYLVVICDGMADRKIEAFGNKTPMEVACKPTMDGLCTRSLCGRVLNVPAGMVPESDTANLAILSYDPKKYSKGRSPLEAVSMGLTLSEKDTAIRCNVVTLSEEEERYEDKIRLDHSADEITTEEADKLVAALNEKLSTPMRHLYTGVSYRHCLIWENASDTYNFNRPHDIIGQRIGEYLPNDEAGKEFLAFMKESYEILNHHPVNEERRRRGLRPANSAWLWSPGRKPFLPSFSEKWGVKGAVISAVDLIKGIGLCASMEVINVEGATGNIHTNYEGKAQAAIDAFRRGAEFVYVHVEAPDECGHRGETENKVRSIEYIDQRILLPVLNELRATGEDFKVLVLPDHPTPIAIRTHSSDPVPFFLYDSTVEAVGVSKFTEDECEKTGLYIADGSTLLDRMIVK
ncbi:MAG: cofactor-independent phosphoglycerate mutase [Clostridia bacterium]|nr:cofactor-independent phosphoglycerate mutase [Clostridia bacterium]